MPIQRGDFRLPPLKPPQEVPTKVRWAGRMSMSCKSAIWLIRINRTELDGRCIQPFGQLKLEAYLLSEFDRVGSEKSISLLRVEFCLLQKVFLDSKGIFFYLYRTKFFQSIRTAMLHCFPTRQKKIQRAIMRRRGVPVQYCSTQ